MNDNQTPHTMNTSPSPESPKAGVQPSLEDLYNEARKFAQFLIHRKGYEHNSRSATDVVNSVVRQMEEEKSGEFERLAQDPEEFKKVMFGKFGKIRTRLRDYHEARLAKKRGGGAHHESLDESAIDDLQTKGLVAFADERPGTAAVLAEELEALKLEEPRIAEVLHYRILAGMSRSETAKILGVSEEVVKRDFARGQILLRRRVLA